jgi:hypothetical protein
MAWHESSSFDEDNPAWKINQLIGNTGFDFIFTNEFKVGPRWEGSSEKVNKINFLERKISRK